jgi:hypothetical protein
VRRCAWFFLRRLGGGVCVGAADGVAAGVEGVMGEWGCGGIHGALRDGWVEVGHGENGGGGGKVPGKFGEFSGGRYLRFKAVGD